MSRIYGEPVDVAVHGGRPARFVWRGRPYLVLRVFDHWVVSREWWRRPDRGPAPHSDEEFWRVEAISARTRTAATYDLRRDAATGQWVLARVWD